jgi:hypothetical protein
MEALVVKTQREALDGISRPEMDRLMATLMSIKRNIVAREAEREDQAETERAEAGVGALEAKGAGYDR